MEPGPCTPCTFDVFDGLQKFVETKFVEFRRKRFPRLSCHPRSLLLPNGRSQPFRNASRRRGVDRRTFYFTARHCIHHFFMTPSTRLPLELEIFRLQL